MERWPRPTGVGGLSQGAAEVVRPGAHRGELHLGRPPLFEEFKRKPPVWGSPMLIQTQQKEVALQVQYRL